MNPEHEHLASAYVDGELTLDERRIAEADAEVMAEVAELRAVRAALSEVDATSTSTRETAIAAAMSAFRDLHPETTGTSSSVDAGAKGGARVPTTMRRGQARWLSIAAVALIVGALGVVMVRGMGGGSDQSADDAVAEQATAALAAEPAQDSTSSRLTEATDDAEMATAATAPAADMTAEESGAEEAGATLEAPASESALSDSAGAPALDDPAAHFDDDVPIESPLQLRSAAEYLLDQRDTGELGPTPEYSCPYYAVLGAADYLHDGVRREVLIDVDEEANLVTAVDRETCEIVEVTALDP